MQLVRIVLLAVVCSFSLAGSLAGRTTSSPGLKTAYLEPGGSRPGGTPPVTASLPFGGASEALRPEAVRGRLWLPSAPDVPPFEPAPDGQEPEPAPLDPSPRFLGQLDDEILNRICKSPVKALKPLGGGSSITLKVTFDSGTQAALKPEQVKVTRYQSEIAAYRLSRALGLAKVPPSCVRMFPKEQLLAGMPKDLAERMQNELIVNAKGEVACAIIAWVPKLHGLRLESADWWRPLLQKNQPIPAGKRIRLLDISTLILFDYLILNQDRWSGGNTHESDGQMVFIDQGAGFGPDRHHRRSRHALSTLKWSQRFSREVAEELFKLELQPLLDELEGLLTPEELDDFAYRIEHAREYLRSLRRSSPKDSLL